MPKAPQGTGIRGITACYYRAPAGLSCFSKGLRPLRRAGLTAEAAEENEDQKLGELCALGGENSEGRPDI